jgi:hypothetical protein
MYLSVALISGTGSRFSGGWRITILDLDEEKTDKPATEMTDMRNKRR